jgi:hypothetical protein
VHRSCDAKKIESSSDGGDSVSKKCKQSYGGVWRTVLWNLDLGGQLYVGAFGMNLASVVEQDVHIFKLIYLKLNFIDFVL